MDSPSTSHVSSLELVANKASGLRSNVHILPPEIISRIMTFSLPSFFYSNFKLRKKSFPQSLILCLVCHRWHHIGWSTPQLWTALTIDLNAHRAIDLQTNETLQPVEKWFSRSGSLPISIRILATHNHFLAEDDWGLVHLWLSQYHERLTDLDLRVPLKFLRKLARSPTPLNLPNLSTLFLKSVSKFPDHDLCFRVANLNETLVDVSVSRLYLKFISLPWRSITHLELRQFFKDEILIIVSQIPNLIHLVLRNMSIGDGGHHRDKPEELIHLDMLETLDFYPRGGFETDGTSLLEALQAPKLRTIRVIQSPISLTVAGRLLGMSQTNLTALIVLGSGTTEELLLHIWAQHPGLCVVVLDSEDEKLIRRRGRLSTLDVVGTYGPRKDGWRHVGYFLPSLEQGEHSGAPTRCDHEDLTTLDHQNLK